MARAAAEFLKRWTEGFQSGRAGRVERDQRLAKESDRQGLMALNADVEALVGQTGRPLEMGEWGQLLAKHGRSMTDAEPFVRAGLFAKPQTGADLLRRQLDETRLKAEQTKLDRLVNPQPEQPTAYQQWQMSQPERPQFIPGSEGQTLKDGRAVDIPGFRRQSPIAVGGPAGDPSQWSDEDLLAWQQKLAPEIRVIEDEPKEIFAPGVETTYRAVVQELERRRGQMTPWWQQTGPRTFDTGGQMGFGQQGAPRRRVFDPATGTLR